MALVNSAIELVAAGQRVLIVDFDLEAPGLETFNLPKPANPVPGIVDFVTTYSETGVAPEVKDYIHKCPVEIASNGELWIMPAGLQDDDYSYRLNRIDWRHLYSELDGYLLFEDLKAQWKEHLAPDYVLIDSRTGYTDVAGICTRQLPDAVVCMFFPTEQNLHGMEKVVSKIRSEEVRQGADAVQLLFVNSNVPDLDDEHSELERRLEKFREKLGYDSLAATIHRYPSLALLNQDIFALNRKGTRLAEEYRTLLGSLRRLNHEDREGAIAYLEHARQLVRRDRSGRRSHDQLKEMEDRLRRIHSSHDQDAEVLTHLADIRRYQGQLEEALALLSKAADLADPTVSILMQRADVAHRLDNDDIAVASINQVLSLEETNAYDVGWAIRWLQDIDLNLLSQLRDSPAIRALETPELLNLCSSFLSSDQTSLQVAEFLIRSKLETDSENKTDLLSSLLLNLVAQRKHTEAALLADTTILIDPNPSQRDLFNYGIAQWAVTGAPKSEYFSEVISLRENESSQSSTANYTQCMSLACWVCGDTEAALDWLSTSRQIVMSRPTSELSCWRYLTISPEEFLNDLQSMENFYKEGVGNPDFLTPPTNAVEEAQIDA